MLNMHIISCPKDLNPMGVFSDKDLTDQVREAVASKEAVASSTQVHSEPKEKCEVPTGKRIRVLDIHLGAEQGDRVQNERKDFSSFFKPPPAGNKGDSTPVKAKVEETEGEIVQLSVPGENNTFKWARYWARNSIETTHTALKWQARRLRNERSGAQEEDPEESDQVLLWDSLQRKSIIASMQSLSNYLDHETLGFGRVDTLGPSKPPYTTQHNISDDFERFINRHNTGFSTLTEVPEQPPTVLQNMLQRYIDDMRSAARYVDSQKPEVASIDEAHDTDVLPLPRFDFADMVKQGNFYRQLCEYIDPRYPDPETTLLLQKVAPDRVHGLPPFVWKDTTNQPIWITHRLWSCSGRIVGENQQRKYGPLQLQIAMDHLPPNGLMKLRALGSHWEIAASFEMDQRRPDAEQRELPPADNSCEDTRNFEVVMTTTNVSPAVVLGVLFLAEKPLCGAYVLEKGEMQTRVMVDDYRPSILDGRRQETQLVKPASWTEAIHRYAIAHSALDIDAEHPPLSLISHECKDALCGEEHQEKFWVDPQGQCYDLGCFLWPLRSTLRSECQSVAHLAIERLPDLGLITLVAVGRKWQTFGYFMGSGLMHEGPPKSTQRSGKKSTVVNEAVEGSLISCDLRVTRLFGRLSFNQAPAPGPYMIKSGEHFARARVDPMSTEDE